MTTHPENRAAKAREKAYQAARVAVARLEEDICDRGGLGFAGVDGETMVEIREAWAQVIAAVFAETKRKLACCAIVGSYYENYDAYGCSICNAWLEPLCGDETCVYCQKRPERPYVTGGVL